MVARPQPLAPISPSPRPPLVFRRDIAWRVPLKPSRAGAYCAAAGAPTMSFNYFSLGALGRAEQPGFDAERHACPLRAFHDARYRRA